MMDNKAVHVARLHWIIFVWPVMLVCFAAFLSLRFPQLRQPSLILLAVGLFWVGVTWVTYRMSSLTITPKQLVLRTGLLVRETIDIPLSRIESVDIRQSLLGSMLRYGSLLVTGTGGTRQVIHHLNRPLTCRRHIEQLMHH